MLTVEEVKEKLAEQFDEVLLLELLRINSFELVDRFEDKIEDNIDFFRSQVTEASDGQDEAQETED